MCSILDFLEKRCWDISNLVFGAHNQHQITSHNSCLLHLLHPPSSSHPKWFGEFPIFPDLCQAAPWQAGRHEPRRAGGPGCPGCLAVESLALVTCPIFPLHLSKVLRLPRKSDAKSYEVLHLSRKIIFPKLKIWCSKMQPLSGNQRPDLLTSLMNMSLALRLPRTMHLCRSSANVPRLPSLLEMLQNLHVLLTFDKVHDPLRLPRETTSESPKVLRIRQFFYRLLISKCASRHNSVHCLNISTSKRLRSWRFLYILTWKCASRHNGVHIFDISTSKSGPNVRCV